MTTIATAVVIVTSRLQNETTETNLSHNCAFCVFPSFFHMYESFYGTVTCATLRYSTPLYYVLVRAVTRRLYGGLHGWRVVEVAEVDVCRRPFSAEERDNLRGVPVGDVTLVPVGMGGEAMNWMMGEG